VKNANQTHPSSFLHNHRQVTSGFADGPHGETPAFARARQPPLISDT
jgi:hypothetical protein